MFVKPLKKIGVLISGSGTNFQSLIDTVHQKDGEIVVVISNNCDAYGLERGKCAQIPAVAVNPQEYPSNEAFDRKIIGLLKEYGVELVVLAGYMKIITSDFVKAYPNAIINIHPALIPSFCGVGFYGMRVHQAVINYGVKVTGATVHFVNEVADGGPIIAQEIVLVDDEDTPETIQKKVLKVEHELLPRAVRAFCLDQLDVVGRIVKKRKNNDEGVLLQ
ncbi:phosphoribosylglycinamide formyltransferase [Acetobacterium woodii]|uniref:Phosphoribosylglycinamide formyltransferase n=1 Tax=Acetobacterium woodii (strain ATCC 29683 / DSM 1030 / JCM 2381 / KCTC 1655 / WB1) TaxID=931626 RepID=H6LH82_ACEWD|nr:phosphoribosylglycinamide formyltransferase [Acetobacterium woodii]AFA48420.1 phosphoribosylglycinamide formyltransferase PurN [Acetobacterium woodii DSM 1030]